MRVTLLVRLCVLLSALGLVANLVSPVSAAKPFKETIDDEFDEVLCGIPVHTTVTGHLIFHIQDYVIQADNPDADDFWIGVIQTHLTFRTTNAEGVILTESIRQTRQEGDLVDNGDGTWTYTFAISGKASELRSGNKRVTADVGRIAFEEVIYFGDLSTVEDNEQVSFRITSFSGPHPQAESDFTLFCEVVNDILG